MENLSQPNVGTREYYESRTLPKTESRQIRLKRIQELRDKLSGKVNSEIIEQMPGDIRSDIPDLADEDAMLANGRALLFLSKEEYSLSDGALHIESPLYAL